MEKQSRLSPDERGNLVAYLDGELGEGETQAIEKTLSRSQIARHEVEMLTRTWELLDELPKPSVSGEFTARTVSLSRQLDVAPIPIAQRPWYKQVRRGVVALGWILLLSCSAIIGFLITHHWTPREHDVLVEELPVIENVDIYSEVDDAEFLRDLERSGVLEDFEPDKEEAPK